MSSKVFYQWSEPQVSAQYRTGVSLHSHTNHSQESLEFIVLMGRNLPWLWRLAEWKIAKCQRSTGISVNLERAFWTPPLTASMAYNLETRQIADLGLDPLVSLSDHDNIEAPTLLSTIHDSPAVPISVEWSAEYRKVMFHIGVHNLPPARAPQIMAELAAYTAAPNDEYFRELLLSLITNPEVLVVLNHPLWDLYCNGAEVHRAATLNFLKEHGQLLHALEINGLRTWEENRAVRELAEGWNLPVISGGDRHGCEPNANINLTNAGSFAEFIDEVRTDHRSHVLMMPQYTEPMPLRILQTVLDVIRDYPEHAADSRGWDDRVFHPQSDNTYLPVSAMWNNGRPKFFERIFTLIRLVEGGPVRKALRFALHDEEKVRLALEPLPSGQE